MVLSNERIVPNGDICKIAVGLLTLRKTAFRYRSAELLLRLFDVCLGPGAHQIRHEPLIVSGQLNIVITVLGKKLRTMLPGIERHGGDVKVAPGDGGYTRAFVIRL